MILHKFESPVSRLGFVLFCASIILCMVAFFVSYRSYYDVGLNRLAYLLLDSSGVWQQSVFKFGFFGALVGAALAWNLLSALKRLYSWVVKA